MAMEERHQRATPRPPSPTPPPPYSERVVGGEVVLEAGGQRASSPTVSVAPSVDEGQDGQRRAMARHWLWFGSWPDALGADEQRGEGP
jgi:hypothetical protein